MSWSDPPRTDRAGTETLILVTRLKKHVPQAEKKNNSDVDAECQENQQVSGAEIQTLAVDTRTVA